MSGKRNEGLLESTTSVTVREQGTRNIRKKNKPKVTQKQQKTKGLNSTRKILKEKENINHSNLKKPCTKVSEKYDAANTIPKTIIETAEHQIEKVKRVLKEPLSKILLTSEELEKLAMKYKLDGHYRVNINLPPFNALLDNEHFENSNTCVNPQQNLELNSQRQSTEFCETTNVTNSTNNMQLYSERHPLVSYNYQQIFPNTELRTCNDRSTDMLDNNREKLHAGFNEIPNTRREHYTCNLMNTENFVRSMDHQQNFEYANTSLSSVMANSPSMLYDDSHVESNVLQQCNLPYRIHYKNLIETSNEDAFKEHQFTERNITSVNSAFINKDDYSISRLRNEDLLSSRNGDPVDRPIVVESWNNIDSLYAPYTTNMDSCYNKYNIHNDNIMCHSSNVGFINNNAEKENNYNPYTGAQVYPFALNNGNFTQDYDANNADLQRNFNSFPCERDIYTTNSATIVSDAMNHILEMDPFVASLISTNEKSISSRY